MFSEIVKVFESGTLPPRYANPETSGLTVKIAAGESQMPAIHLKK